jgi:hypothetical protein
MAIALASQNQDKAEYRSLNTIAIPLSSQGEADMWLMIMTKQANIWGP